jgi:hypothetical protein
VLVSPALGSTELGVLFGAWALSDAGLALGLAPSVEAFGASAAPCSSPILYMGSASTFWWRFLHRLVEVGAERRFQEDAYRS